jgi:cytochrome d ubiquinol oxidase subunit I
VYGLLRTADSLTPTITGTDVALSLALYVIVYSIVYVAAGIYLLRLIRQGPGAAPAPDPTARPARPMSAAGEA